MSDNIIYLNEVALKSELKNLVRNSVEKTLNELLKYYDMDDAIKRALESAAMHVKRG